MALTPNSVFRYFETDGVPASGPHNPIKQEIIDLLNGMGGASGIADGSITDAKLAADSRVEARANDFIYISDFMSPGKRAQMRVNADVNIDAEWVAAKAAALAQGRRSIRFPSGEFVVTTPIILDSSDWHLVGEGRSATAIKTADPAGTVIRVDGSAGWIYRGSVSAMSLENTAPTPTGGAGIEVRGSTSVANTGAFGWTFQDLRFRRCFRGIFFTETQRTSWGGIASIGQHSYNKILNIEVPISGDGIYPQEAICWSDAIGVANMIIGGHLRATRACISAGYYASDPTLCSVGDSHIIGVHCNIADYGVYLRGASNPAAYNSNVVVTGCQFDALNIATVHYEYLNTFHHWANNAQIGVTEQFISCEFSASIAETRDTLYLRGVAIPKVVSLLHRLEAGGAASGAEPYLGINTGSANVNLGVKAKGTGVVHLANQGADCIDAYPGTGTIRLQPSGSSATIGIEIFAKSTGAIKLGFGSTTPLGFFGAAGVAKPTVSGAKGGNAALTSLLTALASLGLVTDSST